MDRLAVLSSPNDESVVLTDAGEELIVWRELQFQNLILYATQDCHRSLCLHVPQDDGSIGSLLEDGALLSSGNDVARVGNGDR